MSTRCSNSFLATLLRAFAGSMLLAAVTHAAPQARQGRVLIETRSQVAIPHAIVRVADVAEVSGGQADVRRFVSHLDLDEIDTAPGNVQIRKSQIRLRLRLAGLKETDFQLVGTAETSVRREHAKLNDQAVIRALRGPLAEAWQLNEDTIHIRLERPLAESVKKQISFDAQSRLEPLLPTDIQPGRLRPTIGVYRNEQLIDTFAVPVNVYVEQLVAVARRSLKVGERLTIDNVLFQRQRLIGPSATQTVASQGLGQYVQRPLRANELIKVFDISTELPVEKRTPVAKPTRTSKSSAERTVVRSRTPVIVVARRGTLRGDRPLGRTHQERQSGRCCAGTQSFIQSNCVWHLGNAQRSRSEVLNRLDKQGQSTPNPMKRTPHKAMAQALLLVIAMLSCLVATATAQAQSIWKHRRASMVNLTGDTAARQIGDLITIVVSEATDVANRDQRQLGKTSDTAFNMDFSSTGDVGSGAGTFDFSKDSNRNFSGQSQFTVAQELTDRVTVEILDMRPNGVYVLGGKRQRLVAGETRTLLISGVVRDIDIGPSNTVRSQHIANFKIAYEGDGPESSFTNQGWAGRFVNKIWPF